MKWRALVVSVQPAATIQRLQLLLEYETEIEGVLWNGELPPEGAMIELQGSIKEWRGTPQIQIEKWIRLLAEEERGALHQLLHYSSGWFEIF